MRTLEPETVGQRLDNFGRYGTGEIARGFKPDTIGFGQHHTLGQDYRIHRSRGVADEKASQGNARRPLINRGTQIGVLKWIGDSGFASKSAEA
jgi:hypothetical protein